jgi:prolyl 4-hydroxylase
LQIRAKHGNSRSMAKIRTKTSEERLRDFGKTVSRKLADSPCQRVEGQGLTIYAHHGFLNTDDCAKLVAFIDQDRKPSPLFVEHSDKEFRTSDTCFLDHDIEFIAEIDTRICTLMGLDPRHGEELQGQVYEIGQQYKPHFDWLRRKSSYWEKAAKSGGQRSWTAMIYLNEPALGGETNFPTANLSVRPRTGTLLMWNNMQSDGTPNEAALHAGTPVSAGSKYVITKWFRERFWR